jgi:hypothetical protein
MELPASPPNLYRKLSFYVRQCVADHPHKRMTRPRGILYRKPQIPASHHTDSSNSIVLLPSRLPAPVRNCTNPNSTGTSLLYSYRESCIPAFLPIFIGTTKCKKLYIPCGFHLPAHARGLPADKVKVVDNEYKAVYKKKIKRASQF